MQRPSRVTLFALLAVALGLAPAVASAQTGVIVLGIRSVEGDDEFARNLTGALRNEAAQVRGWSLSDREVTLAQLVLAHGCEEPDQACMSQIADSLRIDRILYGEARRTSAGEQYDFAVDLHLFDGETDSITASVADTIPRIRRDIDDLREPARRYVAALSGAPRLGTARIVTGVPDAEVFIDGEAVGVTDADGVLLVENVQAGNRSVRIEGDGGTYTGALAVEAYAEATLEAQLGGGGGGGGGGGMSGRDLSIGIGAALTGLGVALAGAWIGSWAYLQDWSSRDDGVRSDWTDARGVFPTTVRDVCNGESTLAPDDQMLVEDMCSQLNTLEMLPFVFGISAAVVGGVGLGLLISGLTSEDETEHAFQLVPSIGLDHAYLGARVAF